MSISVSIDPDLCIGSGECVRRVPIAFVIDEDAGVSVPRPSVSQASPADLREAARNCPTSAITVTDDGGLPTA